MSVNYKDLVEKFGSPLFVYNADKIESQVKTLLDGFNKMPVRIMYAMKALSNLNIIKIIHQAGAGVDAVSIQEVKLALHAGLKPEDILFTPSSVSFDEIQEACDLGVHVNIDNLTILEKFAAHYGNTKEVCIRLNPHLMAGGNHKISTGHIDSKFGISIYQIRHLLKIVKSHKIKVSGLHVHTGSDILDSEVFLQGADIIFDIAKDFEDLKFIDFGSGFKVAYKENDIVTNIKDLGEKLAARYDEFTKEYGRKLEIWFEPGKFIVSEAGILVCTVNTLKTTPTSVFVGVDSGLNHLIRPMMYDAHHDIINLTNQSGQKRVYTVVGQICETDTLGQDQLIDEVHEGDLLGIKNAGAYAYSMASQYNSRFRPAEVLQRGKSFELIRKRDEFEDLIKNQIIL